MVKKTTCVDTQFIKWNRNWIIKWANKWTNKKNKQKKKVMIIQGKTNSDYTLSRKMLYSEIFIYSDSVLSFICHI